MPTLLKYCQDSSAYVRRAAYVSLGHLTFEDSFSLLNQAYESDNDENNLREIVTSIGNFDEPAAISFIETAKNSLNERVSDEASSILIKKALLKSENPLFEIKQILGELQKAYPSKRSYYLAVSSAIASMGKDALPVLDQLLLEESEYTDLFKRIVGGVKSDWKLQGRDLSNNPDYPDSNDWSTNPALWSNNPTSASPDRIAAQEVIRSIQEFYTASKSRHPEEFIGITLYGSLGFGYWVSGSDTDCALISTTNKVREASYAKLQEALPKRITKFDPNSSSLLIDKNGVLVNLGSAKKLFMGAFIGDMSALKRIQQATLGQLKDNEWNQIRITIDANIIEPTEKIRVRHQLSKKMPGNILHYVVYFMFLHPWRMLDLISTYRDTCIYRLVLPPTSGLTTNVLS